MEIREGDVFTYSPVSTWCREGCAVAIKTINNDIILVDTYWSSLHNAPDLNHIELKTIDLIFNINDYDELDRYARGSEELWKTYKESDRQYIPSQHGLKYRYFIKKGAKPDLETQIRNAEQAYEEALQEADRAEMRAKYLYEEVSILKKQFEQQ